MSHSSTVFDHVTDKNYAETVRLNRLYVFPDFVKSASQDEVFNPQNLPPNVYADPQRTLYPCHNAASTWLSALFFAEKRAEYNPKIASWVEQRLEKAIDLYGIRDAVEQVRTKHAELNKHAQDNLPDSDFAFVWVGDDGHKVRQCRMKSAAEVKIAADWLRKFHSQLNYADRNVIADKILEKAAAYGASLGADLEIYVEKQAGRGFCDHSEVVTMIRNRAKLATDNNLRAQVEKLAEFVAAKPATALTPDTLKGLVTTIENLDRSTFKLALYTPTIPAPEDVIFKVTIKEAKDGVGVAVPLTTGNVYDRTQFRKIALADLQALFGTDFASEVSNGLDVDPVKLADIATTLPANDAQLFEKLLNEARIPPLATKAASQRGGLTPSQVAMLAGTY